MRNRSRTFKRFLSLFLLLGVLAMVFNLSPFAADAAELGDITGACSFRASSKRMSLDQLTDGSDKTKLSFNANDWFSLQWSMPLQAQGVYLVWEKVPSEYYIEQRNYEGETISVVVFTGGLPQAYLPLDEDCGMVLLYARSKGALTEAYVCDANTTLPTRVHTWLPPAEEADLMLVVAHPGDEFTTFPDLLETYVLKKKLTLALVYMSGGTEQEMGAALDALWDAGIRQLPTVGSFGVHSRLSLTELTGPQTTEQDATAFVAEQIRRYQPRVLVSHGESGEEGDALRDETYRVTRQAASLAINQEMFPQSVINYGVWRVSKLYLQNFSERQLSIGQTTYGLVSSTVGQDSGQNDIFENIPLEAYVGYAPPEATAAPVATPVPYVPTAAPTATAEPDSVKLERVQNIAWIAISALVAVIVLLVLVLGIRVIIDWRKNGIVISRKKAAEAAALLQAETAAESDTTAAPADTPEAETLEEAEAAEAEAAEETVAEESEPAQAEEPAEPEESEAAEPKKTRKERRAERRQARKAKRVPQAAVVPESAEEPVEPQAADMPESAEETVAAVATADEPAQGLAEESDTTAAPADTPEAETLEASEAAEAEAAEETVAEESEPAQAEEPAEPEEAKAAEPKKTRKERRAERREARKARRVPATADTPESAEEPVEPQAAVVPESAEETVAAVATADEPAPSLAEESDTTAAPVDTLEAETLEVPEAAEAERAEEPEAAEPAEAASAEAAEPKKTRKERRAERREARKARRAGGLAEESELLAAPADMPEAETLEEPEAMLEPEEAIEVADVLAGPQREEPMPEAIAAEDEGMIAPEVHHAVEDPDLADAADFEESEQAAVQPKPMLTWAEIMGMAESVEDPRDAEPSEAATESEDILTWEEVMGTTYKTEEPYEAAPAAAPEEPEPILSWEEVLETTDKPDESYDAAPAAALEEPEPILTWEEVLETTDKPDESYDAAPAAAPEEPEAILSWEEVLGIVDAAEDSADADLTAEEPAALLSWEEVLGTVDKTEDPTAAEAPTDSMPESRRERRLRERAARRERRDR